MRLATEFLRLPLTFDAPRLADEISQFDERDWRPHPQGYPGNTALALIAADGDPDSDEVKGPMRPTPHLDRCPYLRQVLAAFHAVWGRTRLMRLDGNAEATPHSDTNYYWTQHVRVHVPIVTDANVQFVCGEKSVHMNAGEAWIFDTWQRHNVINPHPTRRIHLVADTIGSAEFWELVARAGAAPTHVPFDPLRAVPIATETFNHPIVMAPAEMDSLAELIASSLSPVQDRQDCLSSTDDRDAAALRETLDRLRHDWRAAWARFGESRDGWPLYRQLLQRAEAGIAPLNVRLQNNVNAVDATRNALLRPALDDAPQTPRRATRTRKLERPVFIVCSPRSGSSLFFETLAQSPTFWTIGGESHALIESIGDLHPSKRRFHSNRLSAADATPPVVAQLEDAFVRNLRNRNGQAPRAGATGLRLLEKTPKNSLRVPFLAEAFPDARFVYLYRDMRDTISSMLDAWRSGKFVTYPQLPGWEGPPWSLLLTPGWRELSGKSLAEIVAAQWSTATRYLLDDLEQLPPDRWCVASYDALVHTPNEEVRRLAKFLEFEWDRELAAPLPLSRTTLTAPDAEKWKRNAAELEIALPLVAEVAGRATELFAGGVQASGLPSVPPPARGQAGGLHSTTTSEFRSVATKSFSDVLDKIGSSLLVSTYQSGRLIALRAVDGQLNTHFRAFPSPMGIAATRNGLTLGTQQSIWRFRNQPGLVERADAVYVPAASYATGDIRVHELAYAGNELVIVNTRFSCLCTLDPAHSFRPTWQPSFITDLLPEDRCHLNGVAIVDGRPRFVTALGESNSKAGWRENKANGGIVIDVTTNEVIARGLSMPHSPRWYDGKLWVLESGEGRLVTIDPRNGASTVIAEVPGFARGLAFAGPFAFIGLSQVRESVFDGIPIARKTDRNCGVWVVDLRDGSIAAFLRFEGIVQEIFDIQLLAGIRHPDILQPEDELAGRAFLLPARAAEVTI